MAKIIGLPKLSPTMDEGTLAAWTKDEGDAVEVDDLLAEVETDKATMEFRSFDKGVLLKKLVPEGTTLAPDQPVAILGQAGEDISGLLAEVEAGGSGGSARGSATAEAGPRGETAPQDVGGGQAAAPAEAPAPAAPTPGTTQPAPGPGLEAPEAPAPPTGADEAAAGAFGAAPGGDGSRRVFASPLVRRLARERGLDLSGVPGSGPRGRIIKRDLDELAGPASVPESAPGASRPAVASGLVERRPPERIPVSQMRKTIARRLTQSKQDLPHYYLTHDIDAGPLVEARRAINAELERDGEKVSLNDLVVKGCALALRRVPGVNASFQGDHIDLHQVVDVSVAVAIPEGLITPVIRDADRKGVRQIAQEVKDLAGRAREKKLRPEEFTGGTFSVSNLGMFGIESFTAVINPPEAAILAVGTLREEPVVSGGQVVPGTRMRMTLSCDHRVVDGAVGAEFLAELRTLLERPITMIL